MIGLPVLRRVCGFSLHILSIFLALILTAFCFLVYGIDGTRIVYVSDWSGVGPVKQWAETGEVCFHPFFPLMITAGYNALDRLEYPTDMSVD
jgi:hypothetical protein